MEHNNFLAMPHSNTATSCLSTNNNTIPDTDIDHTFSFQQRFSNSYPQKNKVSKVKWYPDSITRAVQFHPQRFQLTLRQYLQEHYHDSRKDLILELEKFVNAVITSDDLPCTQTRSSDYQKLYAPNMLAKRYYSTLLEFIWLLSTLPPNYEFSETINTLTRCCHAMNLMNLVDKPLHDLRKWSSQRRHIIVDNSPSVVERFNSLVQLIRHDWYNHNGQSKLNARKKEANRRYQDYCKYVDALFEKYARLLVLRIDLFYCKDLTESKTLHDMQQDVDHLFKNTRHNLIFKEMVGYMSKIEFGIDKGIHCHLIFFLDGSKRNYSSTVYFAQQIGDYWNTTITQGQGAYWNVNINESDYRKKGALGIGAINHNDTDLRTNLNERVIKYFCKTEQFIRPKFGNAVRLYRRGELPEINEIKLGRPRNTVFGASIDRLELL